MVSADQKLISHEFLHPYSESDENLEMVREIFERQAINRKINFSIFTLVDQLRKQQNLYQKIRKGQKISEGNYGVFNFLNINKIIP